jgi:hypothetical protein
MTGQTVTINNPFVTNDGLVINNTVFGTQYAFIVSNITGNLQLSTSPLITPVLQLLPGQLPVEFRTKIYPGDPTNSFQTATGLYGGTGAPNNANGSDGDFYFRSDGALLSSIYQRRVGAWVGIV